MKQGIRLAYLGVLVTLVTFIIAECVKPSIHLFEDTRYAEISVGICFIIGMGLGFLYPRKAGKEKSIGKYRNQRKDMKRYSIVFVDDMFKELKNRQPFKDRLSNFDLFLMRSVDDVKQLVGFDIIVLDILGVTSSLKDGRSLINDLYQSYPQKYLVAVSTSSDALKDIREYVDFYIQKMKGVDQKTINEDLADRLIDHFRTAFPIMDDANKYWKMIEEKISSEPENKKESFRKVFEHSILDNPSYTK